MVTDIQHFSLHDGPGIRTTVFLKGCPLSCRWCHNPETINPESDLMYQVSLCSLCGMCVESCPQKCISLREDKLYLQRNLCIQCGHCSEICPTGALEIKGHEKSIDEIVSECLVDKPFYKKHGGVTISGGEPLFYQDGIFTLLEKLKQKDLNILMDTCGLTDWDRLYKASAMVDHLYYDIKGCDSRKHREWTGSANEVILENLKQLLERGISLTIRYPVIPGYNDKAADIEPLIALLQPIKAKPEVHLLPYHQFGRGKYKSMGREYPMGDARSPSAETMENLSDYFRINKIRVRTFRT